MSFEVPQNRINGGVVISSHPREQLAGLVAGTGTSVAVMTTLVDRVEGGRRGCGRQHWDEEHRIFVEQSVVRYAVLPGLANQFRCRMPVFV